MQIDFDAWLGRTRPIEVATPLYESTETVLSFTVRTAEDYSTVKTLATQDISFTAKDQDGTEVIAKTACTITDGDNGICQATIAASVLAAMGGKECIGELDIRESGAEGDITDRVLFNFSILNVFETE